MITVPEEVARIIEKPGRTFTAKIDFGSTDYTGITGLIRTSTLAPNGSIAIGEAVSANIQVTLTDRVANVANYEFLASISIAGEDFNLGYFTAEKPVKSGKITQINAYDRMAYAERVTYQSALTYPSTVNAVFAEIVGQINPNYDVVQLAQADNLTIDADVLSGFPCRDALAYLAGYLGANCIVNADGDFKMQKYVDETSYTLRDNTMEAPDFADETTTVSGLACTVSDTVMLVSGNTALPMSFVCPLMTQTRLNAILAELSSSSGPLYQYSAAVVNQLCGDPRIELGDVITMVHNNETFVVPVMSLTFDFDGGLIVGIQSCDVQDTTGLTLAQKIDIAFQAVKNPSKYAEAAATFSELIGNSLGLYKTEETMVDGSKKYYFHDKATLAASTYIFTMDSNGFAWSNAWGGSDALTTWNHGIDKNGNAILKMLTAYKISADIITTGTLQSADGTVTVDLDNKSINFGNKLTYDPTNGLNIDGSVTIGGSASIGDTIASEVADAVEDLDFKGIDHQTVEYAISTSGSDVPSDEGTAGHTETLYAVLEQQNDDYLSSISTKAGFEAAYGGFEIVTVAELFSLISDIGNGVYIYSFTRTDTKDGNYSLGGWSYLGYLSTGNSVLLSETLYCAVSNGSTATSSYILDQIDSDAVYAVPLVPLESSGDSCVSFTANLTVGADITISDISTVYTKGSSDTSVIAEVPCYVSRTMRLSTNTNTAKTALKNSIGVTSSYVSIKYGCGFGGGFKYFYKFTATVKANGDIVIGDDYALAAEDGVSYAEFDDDVMTNWSTTMPDVSSNKGKYLWTRTTTTFTDNTSQISYQATYIGQNGAAGQPGQDGTSISISSIKYAVNQNQSTQPSDSSFSTTFPSLNQGDWLWTKTTYSNGSTAITKTYIGNDGEDGDSVIVSNPVYDSVAKTTTFTLTDKNGSKTVVLHDGEDGDEGEHVHFAWANSSDGQTDFSTSNSTNKLYIGVCADSNSSDPQTPSSYSWTLVKGEDGSQVTGQSRSYAISTNGQTPPADGGSVTEKWYIADSSNLPNSAEFVISLFETASGWNNNRSHMGTCISETPWDSTNQYLCSFDRTDYSDGTWDISNLVLVATFGSGSSSTVLATERLYVAYGSAMTTSTIHDNLDQLKQYFGLTQYVTDVDWNSSNSDKVLHSFDLIIYQNGTTSVTNLTTRTYGSGSSSTVLGTDEWWYAIFSDFRGQESAGATVINTIWGQTSNSGSHAAHYFDTSWGSTDKYLYKVKRTVYQNGNTACSNLVFKAEYGQSYPTMGTTAWQDTIPDISAAANKGKYLWTRSVVSYSNGESVTTYTVSYIAADGQPGTPGTPGTNGRSVSSITQYYYASTSDQSSSLPAQMSGSSVNTAWKQLPSELTNAFSETNKYLWSFTRTIYTESNGTTTGSNGSPYIIGTWGQKGDPGSGGSGTAGRGISAIEHQYCIKATDTLGFTEANNETTFANIKKIKFIPSTTGTHVFQSTSNIDVRGYIFNSSGTQLAFDDDSGGSGQFRISYSLTAGTTYYLAANVYNSTNNGKSISATISPAGSIFTDWSTEIPLYFVGGDYWERDKITWTSAPLTTYAPSENGIKSNGMNASLRAANEANAAIGAWCYQNDKTYIDGGKIYTGSITADKIAANSITSEKISAGAITSDKITASTALLEKVFANSGTVQNTISSASNVGQTQTPKMQLDFSTPRLVLKGVDRYDSSKIQSATITEGYLSVESNRTSNLPGSSILFSEGLEVTSASANKASRYGYSATIEGNLTVNGTISGNVFTGYEKGYVQIQCSNANANGYVYGSSSTISFTKTYSNTPVVIASVTETLTDYPCTCHVKTAHRGDCIIYASKFGGSVGDYVTVAYVVIPI